MEKKILFTVMALLVMATGKIWAQTPYALLCPNEGGTTYSMHFLYTTATVNTGDTGGEIEGGSSDSETLTYTILKKNIPPTTTTAGRKQATSKKQAQAQA